MDDDDADFELLTETEVLTEEARLILAERAELLMRCALYEETRAAALRMCTVGTPEMPPYLFFFRMFVMISEPRNPPGLQTLPFVPYEYQVRELAVIHKAVQGGVGMLGLQTLMLWLKSRDMGLTWLILAYFLWDWLVNKGVFHIGSRKEEEVDKIGDPGTLFAKLRFILKGLPPWWIPRDLQDKTLLLSYDDGEVAISGESANPGFGSSKRKKAALLDEFQLWEHDRSAVRSIQHTTNTVFLVGTPRGYGNYYSELARKKSKIKCDIRKVHWIEHPLKAKGLIYRDGKPWSPWYGRQCEKKEPEFIAAELDLSFESSVKGPVFAKYYGIGHQKRGLKLIPGIPVVRAWDPGGWFAVIFLQIDRNRRVRVYREVVTEGCRLTETADEVMRVSEQLVRDGYLILDSYESDWRDWFQFEDPGDPSGATMSKANQEVPEYTDLWEKYQINVEYLFMGTMPTNLRVRSRIIAIENAMQKYIAGNEEQDGPGLWVDVDGCPILDEALRGGYRRKTDPNGNVIDYAIEERHPYVDVVDALGYGVVYKLGIPEQIKRETKRKTEEQEEDEERDDVSSQAHRRSRC